LLRLAHETPWSSNVPVIAHALDLENMVVPLQAQVPRRGIPGRPPHARPTCDEPLIGLPRPRERPPYMQSTAYGAKFVCVFAMAAIPLAIEAKPQAATLRTRARVQQQESQYYRNNDRPRNPNSVREKYKHSASQPGATQIVPRLRKLSKPLRAHAGRRFDCTIAMCGYGFSGRTPMHECPLGCLTDLSG
jgi:hypothetical protein